MERPKIPIDILENILSRVPVKPLLRFKSVCSEWYNLIIDPSFAKLHLQHHHANDHSRNHILYVNPTKFKFYNLDLEAFMDRQPGKKSPPNNNNDDNSIIYVDDDDDENDELKGITERLRINLRSYFHINLVGSSNGIVCLRNDAGWGFTLLNPSTRTHLKLPSLKADKHRALALAPAPALAPINVAGYGYGSRSSYICFGFGYDGVADDYKVVKVEQFDHNNNNNNNNNNNSSVCVTKCAMYSWRKKRWEMSEEMCFPITGMLDGIGKYTANNGTPYNNNALLWLALRKKAGDKQQLVILSFNLCTGKFDRQAVPLPPDIGVGTKSLLDIKGCLHIVSITRYAVDLDQRGPDSRGLYRGPKSMVDLWRMNHNSSSSSTCWETRSWCKLASIVVPHWNLKVITCCKRRDQIVLQTGNVITLANLVTGENMSSNTPTLRIDIKYPTQCYVESLVILDHSYQFKLMKSRNKRRRDENENEMEEIRNELKRCRDREKNLEAENDRLRRYIKRAEIMRRMRERSKEGN